MLDIMENKDLKDLSSMRIGGHARYYVEAHSEDEIKEAVILADKHALPLITVGDGSNMIWSDTLHDCVVLKIATSGYSVVNEDDQSATIEALAGENWDDFVESMVKMDLSGIEAMSAIPGTVGATPVQNVGAYGQEIKDVIATVKVYDTQDGEFKVLSNDECHFGYRDSIFKSASKGRYIIISVVMKLKKGEVSIPKYPQVAQYFADRGIAQPTLNEIREAIIHIRKEKLPDPSVVPNCGSFFENSIVSNSVVEKIKMLHSDVKSFAIDESTSKIPTGWLIEKCGLKGEYVGKLKVHDMNALVLTNPDGAGFVDLIETKQMIIDKVRDKFGIEIESEPNIIE